MVRVTKWVDVEVHANIDLDDFRTDDLVRELEERGYTTYDTNENPTEDEIIDSIEKLYYAHTENEKIFKEELKRFFLKYIDKYI